MEEISTKVAPPVFIHQTVSSQIGRKRDLCYQKPPRQPNWNPDLWNWDCARFVAQPTETEILRLRTGSGADWNQNGLKLGKKGVEDGENERLELNLCGGLNSTEEQRATAAFSRPSKRVRSGSPVAGNYPACLVDNCKEDLSNAKDYHRRHKVCELHSKASKAQVGNQMQRFCQQCSRFHLLSEFDEGKRSCRRRLAGHNRRRRKTQPEEATSQLLIQGNLENPSNKNLELVNLLTVLARAQGKIEDNTTISSPSIPDRDRLMQILDFASKLQNFESLSRKISEQILSNHKNETSGTSVSTVDLLALLSGSQAASSHDLASVLSQRSSDRENTKSTAFNQAAMINSQNATRDARSCLELQLFTSSPENENIPPKLEASKKYFSSGGSNPIEEQSPSSSPVMQSLFPMKNASEIRMTGNNTSVEDTGNSYLPLELFSGSHRGAGQSGCTSSSGSDHSPSSSSSDTQDRTRRIIFKLFDKNPNDLPGTLRSQMYNWLSNCPLEMESYIRPGCVVLSVYVSMSSVAWDQLEKSLLQRVNFLVQDSPDSDFWSKGRFLVNTGRQLASYKNGKICICKSWRSRSSPELISVSPLAIVAGQDATLLVKGRNLTNGGTKIHCAYLGKYSSAEVTESTGRGSTYKEINVHVFKIPLQKECPGVLGRCFIEVENDVKGKGFPVIIADAAICRELKHLEYEFNSETEVCDVISEEHAHGSSMPRSRDQVLNFLNELGWLFQRKKIPAFHEFYPYSLNRFKFLLVFSTERDFTTIAKTILDMLVERNSGLDGLSMEASETLAEIQLLNRAVKRRCAEMIKMLIHYSVDFAHGTSKKYIFPPNIAGSGGLTPLHLAASTFGSDDIIDVLTDDPQQIGLSSWGSLLDANGQSPYNYAEMRNNHSYNTLVARKLTDKRNKQVSVTILDETDQLRSSSKLSSRFKMSCETCGTMTTKYRKKTQRSQGCFFQAPIYIHPVLAVAAVCVCVCLFMRALPNFGRPTHFKWEALACGTS